MKKVWIYEMAVGSIGIAEEDGQITHVFFGSSVQPKEYQREETPVIRVCAKQLQEYFAGRRKDFDLPLSPEGTAFEKEVWQALRTIPYGELRTYGQMAAQLGRPTASRAVGRANGLNPIGILIPCHRVIGANGKLTGYAGGLEMKERLLALEGALLGAQSY